MGQLAFFMGDFVMKNRSLSAWVAAASVAVLACAATGAAQARGNVYWSAGVAVPGVVVGVGNGYSVYTTPGPTYYAPPPVYYPAPAAYYAPPPVYYPPQSGYYPPPPAAYYPPPGYSYGHGYYRGPGNHPHYAHPQHPSHYRHGRGSWTR